MQQAIMHHNWHDFMRELNELLMDGWKIVPGATVFSSIEKVATSATPAHFIDHSGRCMHTHFFAVVENHGVT